MSKYNVDLDLTTKNSLSVIVSKIKKNSKILEFGPSHGRLTKYLKESMNCKVYCLELDADAAKDAAIYSEQIIVGDVENLLWEDELVEKKFNYIIFADVLEHLRDPQKILSLSKKYLEKNGSILISIPNVAHSSILIDLLNNKFIYRDLGLLDNTHIRLFTKTTLDEMIKKSNLFIKFESSIKKNPEDTEFYNSYEDLPDCVSNYIRNLSFSDSYQFIMEIVAEESEIKTSDFEEKNYEEKEVIKYITYKKHDPIKSKIKTIAFYLPQFHPFDENDKWWGKGFTEWTNVTKAKPNFKGHYQPHLPIHNGFYDLRIPEIMKEQAELAKNYGIHGFNFYYYWFDGKILMHKPFEILLEHKEIDINFCITWANENWTRAWDASENEILIAQKHSNDDSKKFIQNLYKFFNDKRYICIDNKPILIIYRCDMIPNIKETIAIWREEMEKAGYPGIYLICAQTYGIRNPLDYGFDAAMEFPPHNTMDITNTVTKQLLNPEFFGNIFDYTKIVNEQCNKIRPNYKCFETLMLSWDNTPRKQNFSNIFTNFTIKKYQAWLSNIIHNTYFNKELKNDEKLIFINAWNEWAEGTHLEPDREYGYNYLESTYNILKNYNKENILLNNINFSKKHENILVIHTYITDSFNTLKDLIQKYKKNQKKFDIYITISSYDDDLVSNIKQFYPEAYIKFIEIRFDHITSFIEIYKELNTMNYNKIWKDHSKKDLASYTEKEFNLSTIILDENNLNDLADFLDYSFCLDEDKDKILTLSESRAKTIEDNYILNKLESLINDEHEIEEIIIPRANNLTISNKISLIFKKVITIKNENEKVLIYGHGYLGKVILSILNDNVVAVIDRNIRQDLVGNYKIIQLNEINNYTYDSIIISLIGREKEIIKILLENGVDKEKISIL